MRDEERKNETEDAAEVEDLEVTSEQSADVSGGAPAIQDISITKQTDVASPKL